MEDKFYIYQEIKTSTLDNLTKQGYPLKCEEVSEHYFWEVFEQEAGMESSYQNLREFARVVNSMESREKFILQAKKLKKQRVKEYKKYLLKNGKISINGLLLQIVKEKSEHKKMTDCPPKPKNSVLMSVFVKDISREDMNGNSLLSQIRNSLDLLNNKGENLK